MKTMNRGSLWLIAEKAANWIKSGKLTGQVRRTLSARPSAPAAAKPNDAAASPVRY